MDSRFRAAHPLYKWLLGFCLLLIIFVCAIPMGNQLPDVRKEKTVSMLTRIVNVATPQPQQYFVRTAQCHIPFVDPFSEDLMKIYKPQTFVTCSNESDLVTTTYDALQLRYVLHINEQVAQQLLNSTAEEYNCFYEEISYGQQIDTYDKLKADKYFTDGYVVPKHVEGMLMECQTAEEPHIVLQRDAFMFIQYQPEEPTPTPTPKAKTLGPRKPSVIMYGIDSLSRINLRRTMPKVHKFLQGPGWYEMQGYNKVADNSFPNLFAILSGYSPDTAKSQVCDTDKSGCFEELPMIWHYFKNASYMTAYAEDESGSNTFNYLKPGFTEKPTDYYFRPFLRALEAETEVTRLPGGYMRYCMGRRLANRYIYDYCRQFMQRYVQERPIWGMFWTNHYSHDDPFMPSAMQNMVLTDLMDYEADGAFEHTIMIFFADHGTRFGKLRDLKSGFLESRLPMMFIYLPPWFRAEYPSYVRALELNRNRLSSNFDLHNTLKHIIEIGGGPELPKSFDCPTCQSLFYPLPEDRTCAQAAIDEHWCTCQPYRTISNLDWADRVAQSVIPLMNEYFVAKNLSHLCSNLSLSYVHNTQIKTGLDISWHDALPQLEVAVYRTKFKVQQNSADFEATVVFNNVTETAEVKVETISRTNSYKEDSTCIDDKIAKLYCICISDLKP
ncbi:uncharacterized protein LOC111079843 [Drosophila obscura]|uniref:uncharacterized protein LOC111079843 n=1 Tax=Drosophila obscura TaxID=7282 RepID=UPI001BB24886|nr:uncharacterized protein LOC111079843 [Drosophila obscura]